MLAGDMDTGELEYISRFKQKMLVTRKRPQEKTSVG
jgi:hypothetical protein